MKWKIQCRTLYYSLNAMYLWALRYLTKTVRQRPRIVCVEETVWYGLRTSILSWVHYCTKKQSGNVIQQSIGVQNEWNRMIVLLWPFLHARGLSSIQQQRREMDVGTAILLWKPWPCTNIISNTFFPRSSDVQSMAVWWHPMVLLIGYQSSLLAKGDPWRTFSDWHE